MKSFGKLVKGVGAAFLSTLWCTSPVWGDDTEIFFGNAGDEDALTNVLFIIDTSGSMSNRDGEALDRLDRVKVAFRQLMQELSNVNVGLMRFTNPGGPVLYPVTYIDEAVATGEVVTVERAVSASSDDVQEEIGGATPGLVRMDDDYLQMNRVVINNAGSIERSVSPVTGEDDDITERLDNGNQPTVGGGTIITSHLYIGEQGAGLNATRTALRFRGLDIPPGATITNAFIRMYGRSSARDNARQLDLLVSGEPDDSGDFRPHSPFAIRDRARTAASVPWTMFGGLADRQSIDSPNIAAVVQEQISAPAWLDGSERDLVFFLDPGPGTGVRAFYNRDASATWAARVFVEYTVGAPTVSNVMTAVRFDGVDIPRGADITSARIEFTAERDFSSSFDLEIAIEDVGDSQPFDGSLSGVTSRSQSGDVDWDESLTASSGDPVVTPDLADLLETVTNDSAWCGGNALTLFIRGESGEIPVHAYDGDPSLAPRLVVSYDADSVPDGASCIRRTITRTVSLNSDDAEETATAANNNSTDLDIDGNTEIGLRFNDVDVPRGATILDARLRLYADGDTNGASTISIYPELTDKAATYTGTVGTITDRAYGTPTSWTVSNNWVDRNPYESSDISNVVAAVTGRAGWVPGSSIGIKLHRQSGVTRTAESRDGNRGRAAQLTITFTDDGSGLRRRTRDVMTELVDSLNHNGWTPVQDTLYEAARYYTGDSVYWGKTRGDSNIDGGPFNYARISAAESMVDGTYTINRPAGCSESNLNDWDCRNEEIVGVGGEPMYESPINDFCQEQSHIILLTDGFANRPHSTDLIPAFTGEACLNEPTLLDPNDPGSEVPLTAGELCVKDLARYMNENDLSDLELEQRVTTHTIGFNFSSQWLEDVATAGGGIYKTADSASELVSAITDIIGDVLETDSTFVAPVAAVNEFNQLSHLSQVYFAVFRPDEVPRWRGNLKRYTLEGGNGDIVDADGNLAIDPLTGFFSGSARSFWSSEPDGFRVERGGAAENVPSYVLRNAFTYYAGSPSRNLADSANQIVSTNNNLTPAMFDVVGFSATEFADHIDWVRGKDVDNEVEDSTDRYVYGDPLHSRPVAITYGGDEDNPDVEVFFGSNAGALHSVNATNGTETFAFYPEALLPMQIELRRNLPTTSHPYGIDGTPTPWVNDNGRNGIDPADTEDFVRIYAGMRRGGRNYYALDATDRANPRLMWQIIGGTDDGVGNDFRELGQTWSRPIKTQILLDGDNAPRDVLLFSAGYDEAQDEAKIRTPDSMGRGMYIVDAVSGDLIWSGGKTGAQSWTESYSEMDYSFPSTMSVIDINGDGLADMWFGADTGGRIWRFDIANGESLANLVTGGVIADLGVAGGGNTIASNRRFFASPSVAIVRGPDGPELALAVGSGFRASPLSILADNRMFMIRQKAVFSAPSTYTAITESDLYDATSNALATLTGDELATEQDLLYSSQGWFFDLNYEGEKVLSSPLIANDRIIFTTYTPGNSGIWCRPAAGTSRAYSVLLEDAVRVEPRPLLTPSIVDQATIIVPPPVAPDPNDPFDPNDPPDPNEPPNPCPNGNNVVIKLNTEDGGVDNWCNDASKTYWIKEQ